MSKNTIFLEDVDLIEIFGCNDTNLRLITNFFKSRITARGDEIIVDGAPEEFEELAKLFSYLKTLAKGGTSINSQQILYSIEMIKNQKGKYLDNLHQEEVLTSPDRKQVTPKTLNQQEYIKAIHTNDIVISIGPAGTGKTYLAVAMAVNFLMNKRVNRIILVRPAVEAGESLGFLPGDLEEKVNPYLRPLHDALHEMLKAERIKKYFELGIIEVIPLAYMRGRTLNNSFVILDEAQNSTRAQMKMFLTRLGFGSKAVVTGDITQIDLPSGNESGLVHIQIILEDIPGIKFVYFNDTDVVRHGLVQHIIRAYEKAERMSRTGKKNTKGNKKPIKI